MSRGVYRGIYSVLEDDDDFLRLSGRAQRVFYSVRVCKEAGPAGIFVYHPELTMKRCHLTRRQHDEAITELVKGNWVLMDGSVMWVRNALRHDPSTTTRNAKHATGIMRWLSGLPHRPIVLRFCDYYELPYPSGWDRKAIPYPSDTKESESESESDCRVRLPSPSVVGTRSHRNGNSGESPGFAAFWQLYPHKVGKQKALESWERQDLESKAEIVCAGLTRTMSYITREGGKWIPHPATWLNQGRWTDEPRPDPAAGVLMGKTALNAEAVKRFVSRGRDSETNRTRVDQG